MTFHITLTKILTTNFFFFLVEDEEACVCDHVGHTLILIALRQIYLSASLSVCFSLIFLFQPHPVLSFHPFPL